MLAGDAKRVNQIESRGCLHTAGSPGIARAPVVAALGICYRRSTREKAPVANCSPAIVFSDGSFRWPWAQRSYLRSSWCWLRRVWHRRAGISPCLLFSGDS